MRSRRTARPRIRVINIYPAATDTEIWDNVEGEWPRNKMMCADTSGGRSRIRCRAAADVLVENITLGNLSGSL